MQSHEKFTLVKFRSSWPSVPLKSGREPISRENMTRLELRALAVPAKHASCASNLSVVVCPQCKNICFTDRSWRHMKGFSDFGGPSGREAPCYFRPVALCIHLCAVTIRSPKKRYGRMRTWGWGNGHKRLLLGLFGWASVCAPLSTPPILMWWMHLSGLSSFYFEFCLCRELGHRRNTHVF